MNPFNKMVQNKRCKMLVLGILLTVAVLIKDSTSINLTYIVKKEGDKLQPNCIAEENERYAAIGWIYPLPLNAANAPNITTKFIPSIHNGFNCKFGKQDKCNKFWALKNWQVDDNSTRTFDLLFDSRWEDLPVIYTGNGSKEFGDRIEIPNVFEAGFSLRAAESVELLICEGWNPFSYHCYHLNISKTEIFLRKFMTLPKNGSEGGDILDSYKAFANILSEDEWRNFAISLNNRGVLSLRDVSVNRTVIQYEDKDALKPLYLLVRSSKPALWKFHQNQFFYTKSPQISRLGPLLYLPSKDLCITLYVSTCNNCAMSFLFTNEGKKVILKDVEPTKDKWQVVKLKAENILTDTLNLFVETKFTENSGNANEGFWAVDDVRVCHENEVKVSFLKLNEEVKDGDVLADKISCQVVQHPKWRPKKLTYSKIQDFPFIDNAVNSTQISLNWTQEDPNNQINYFITYQANDLCPAQTPNLRRIKSNGFLMTKHNEITINNLIPYTTYNITFSSMLHENERRIEITTLEAEQPTLEEYPSKLSIEMKDTKAYASWEKIACSSIYGPILYKLSVTNLRMNLTRELNVQTENTLEINDLEPYTMYTLHIVTARNFDNIQNNSNTFDMSMNFMTQPGKSPPVENLEIYSVDQKGAALRYDLPKNSGGYPTLIQITRCNALSFKKCKSSVLHVTRCKLWPKKHCVDLTNLIPEQHYKFMISLRNNGTQFFGEEVNTDVILEERVPGVPTNLTYKIVDCKGELDYCHLNISWLHPYYQNGTITAFHVILNASDTTNSKDIQEVMQLFNSSFYLPRYEHQIKFIPYSTHYELYIQSVNSKFRSSFAHIHVKTDDIGNHIDQNPVLVDSNPTSVTFRLPQLDQRLDSYMLTIAVQDFNTNLTVDNIRNKKVMEHLCHNFGKTWVLQQLTVNTNETKFIDIGNGAHHLEPETQYCVTFIVTNKYKNSYHDVVYYKKLVTPKGSEQSIAESSNNYLFLLLLLLLLIPIAFLAYRYLKRRKPRRKPRQEDNKENAYESLPFEECEENCVNNDTYDHLLHK